MTDFSYIDQLIENGVKHAVIDVDDTITQSSPTDLGLKMKRERLTNNFLWYLWLLSFVIQVPFFYLIDYFDRDYVLKVVMKKYHSFSLGEIERSAMHLFENGLKTKFIPFTHDLIFHLKAKGVHVVLLSHNIEPLIKQYGEYFGVPYTCLKVISDGSRCLVDLSNLSDFKYREIQKYDPSETIAIGDSKHDFPVLNYVKYPIVVCKKKEKWMDLLTNQPKLITVSDL